MRRVISRLIIWCLNSNLQSYEERLSRIVERGEKVETLIWKAQCELRREIDEAGKRFDSEIISHRHGADGIVMLPKSGGV